MRRIYYILFVFIAATIVAGCSLKSEKPVEFEKDTTDYAALNRDSTIYGICGDGTTMNMLELLTDMGDTVNVDLSSARQAGKLLGGLDTGDRMGVVMRRDSKNTASIVINLSTLLGEWLQPNPLDGSSEMGFVIKEGGVAESVEQSTFIYKSWRIFNGRLELVAEIDGGGDEEDTFVYDILKLAPDTLIIRDGEDTYEYGRHHPSDYEDVNIELEDGQLEFNLGAF